MKKNTHTSIQGMGCVQNPLVKFTCYILFSIRIRLFLLYLKLHGLSQWQASKLQITSRVKPESEGIIEIRVCEARAEHKPFQFQ
jgi:hypothetical protein